MNFNTYDATGFLRFLPSATKKIEKLSLLDFT